MNHSAELFKNLNEYYASGLFEEPDAPYICRYSRAERRYWENCPISVYSGEKLYPCGKKVIGCKAVKPNFSFTFDANYSILPDEAVKLMQTLPIPQGGIPALHTVGGAGFTHSIPHFARVAREGLESYQKRINSAKDQDFRLAMTDVVEGIRNYHSRAIEYLTETAADSELLSALKQVPFKPARTIYEALVCWNFVYYLDGCDNIGILDADLIQWYNGEDVTDILHQFFVNVDINDGWSGAIGPNYNALTLQCLKAVKGMRRPSLELRVTPDMPNEIWDAAEDSIKSGCGQPSFYNETLYQYTLQKKFPDKDPKDLFRFCGGGCTESMLSGISNVGSIDAGINLAYLFREYMEINLAKCVDFIAFEDGFIKKAEQTICQLTNAISRYQKDRAKYKAQPMRTLIIDDCIDNELDFLNGGARHYWSVVNVAGLINVIDSMLAIRELIFEQKKYLPNMFIELLDRHDADLFQNIKHCRSYGNGDDSADIFAQDFTKKIFKAFDQNTPYLGGAFLPSSIQFETYASAGHIVGATPDGRACGDPLCDSIAAIHGRDTNGLLAMLQSAAKLPLDMALGTPVLNIHLNKKYISNNIRGLINGYFKMNGIQVQITCQSRKDMLAALDNPEQYANLIVRIGGYSEYFNRLSTELKQSVIERSEY